MNNFGREAPDYNGAVAFRCRKRFLRPDGV